ncbi:nuclear transport factor 2 family protein [Streptomyces sp. SID13031]|uniref:nuclear transport factor 2 family protein n=1 Tax=Streptomyces sp. SID13031 TaxID=2706046 RepID=UPI0013C56132|nr:nuclear transport factor 2 family protein [Streptomyces sp. SID13031]NEA34449.1 nuclear transport factor 2 family protein [Streptomyces sp. SID13031]
MSNDDAVRAVVGEFLAALGKGDADLIAATFAEEIDWYVPGDQAQGWTGQRTRRDEVPAYFRTMWPIFVPGESETELKKILVDGPDAVILAQFTHTVQANRRRFSTPVAMHLTVENGKLVRMHLYEDTHLVAKSVGAAA